MALAGRKRRFVHLHQIPKGLLHRVAANVARLRASRVLVPSTTAVAYVRGAQALENWTDPSATHMLSTKLDSEDPTGTRTRFTFGYLGRISVDKGVGVLLQALSQQHSHPGTLEAHLRVGGEARFAESEQGLELLRALKSAPNVETLGWVESKKFLNRLDTLVVPSIAGESFGLVAAEAMAAGVPVIATKAGALPEVVGTDHPLLTEPGDAQALAETMRKVLDMSSQQRAEIAAQQYERWQRLWSPQAGRRRVEQLMAPVEGALPAKLREEAS